MRAWTTVVLLGCGAAAPIATPLPAPPAPSWAAPQVRSDALPRSDLQFQTELVDGRTLVRIGGAQGAPADVAPESLEERSYDVVLWPSIALRDCEPGTELSFSDGSVVRDPNSALIMVNPRLPHAFVLPASTRRAALRTAVMTRPCADAMRATSARQLVRDAPAPDVRSEDSWEHAVVRSRIELSSSPADAPLAVDFDREELVWIYERNVEPPTALDLFRPPPELISQVDLAIVTVPRVARLCAQRVACVNDPNETEQLVHCPLDAEPTGLAYESRIEPPPVALALRVPTSHPIVVRSATSFESPACTELSVHVYRSAGEASAALGARAPAGIHYRSEMLLHIEGIALPTGPVRALPLAPIESHGELIVPIPVPTDVTRHANCCDIPASAYQPPGYRADWSSVPGLYRAPRSPLPVRARWVVQVRSTTPLQDGTSAFPEDSGRPPSVPGP